MFFYTAKTPFVISDSPFTDFSDLFKDLMGPEIFKQYRFCGKKSSFDLFLHGKGTFLSYRTHISQISQISLKI